jgi:molybdenum cofactor cytidylyltransferase
MDLIRALRLDQSVTPQSVAFVGSGGKTTAMFQCAQRLEGPVLLTATTHLAVDQLDMADRHYFIEDFRPDRFESAILPGKTLITGCLTNDSDRTHGISLAQVAQTNTLAQKWRVPLLIEADGSRQKPVKAPADHEPPIPGFVDLVVVVAGLLGLGKPIVPTWVHRPEIFAALSGLSKGDLITPTALAQVMKHPKGGLKNVPSKARLIALLNQADTENLQAQAFSLRSILLDQYDAVIINSFAPKPTEADPGSTVHAVYQNIAGVILAAGESQRFGSPKQLLNWHGKPLVWHVAKNAMAAGLKPVVVVCGAEREAIQQALAEFSVEFVDNPDFQQGQGRSVGLGTNYVRSQCGGIVFLLADQPQISPQLISHLVTVHAQGLNPITGPMIDGQRANPVLFDQVTFDDLAELNGEIGGKKLFSKYPVEWIPWYDAKALFDVDTPGDYKQLLEMNI